MKVLITGAHGLLGQKCAIVFAQETGAELLLTDLARESFFTNPRFEYQQLDITRKSDVKSLLLAWRPDVIVNTAAVTDVDACETDREFAWRVNVDGVKHLLIAARQLPSCRLIQISTDYVFDGRTGPYDETSRPSPISYYGKTKLAAENAINASGVPGLVLRTQVLYGTGYSVRRNFVSWVLSQLEAGKPFRVVTDQTGNPTLVDDLAYAIVVGAQRGITGLFHASGPETLTRHEFASAIARVFRFNLNLILPTTSEEIGQVANRPLDSTFITVRLEAVFGFRFSGIDAGLRRLYDQHMHGAQHLDLLTPSST